MRLILIRHPETMANVNKLIYGRTESEYSTRGAASIAWVVEQLRSVSIDEMYASPLQRTKYLAEAIAAAHGFQNIQPEERVMEMHFGIFENMSNSQAKEEYPQEYKNLMSKYSSYQIPGGESFQRVKERVTDFLQELRENEVEDERVNVQEQREADSPRSRNGKTIVVITHSMAIRGALSYLLGISLEDIWHIKLNPASIVDLDYRCGYAMLQQLKSPELA